MMSISLKKIFAPFSVLAPFYAIAYLFLLGMTGVFISQIKSWDEHTLWLIVPALFGYAFLYLLPAVLLPGVAALVCGKAAGKSWHTTMVILMAGILVYFILLALLVDLVMYLIFGFHFNGLVWNLIVTPGGFASMGLRTGTLLPGILGFVLGGGALWGVYYAVTRWSKLRKPLSAPLRSWRSAVWVGGLALMILCASLFYGFYHYKAEAVPLRASDAIPGFIPLTMGGFLKSCGVEAPERNAINLKSVSGNALNYPSQPIVRRADRQKYNLIWLSCESWRWDMLTPEIMPNASEFAAEAVNFKRNFSGGNGTRQGMFSMFYGLYGNYWSSFLENRRGALLLDWMLEDNYDFYCLTSAKFSYPEFDQTIFSRLTAEQLLSNDSGRTFERDQRNTKKLVEFLQTHDKQRPFMAFMFFESPHAPYEFPKEAEIRSDYETNLNYLKVSEMDGTRIKNRYINSSHHLDQRLGDLFRELKAQGLWDNSVIVLVGDHGEEFYEKGRLGHNSSFVNEQIRTPLVIKLPGQTPMVYEEMSSHLDIVPMLAPYFGVTNPAEDFSLGYNLLDGKSQREYTIIAGWSEVFYCDTTYKTLLPFDAQSMVKQQLYDGEDRPLSDTNAFYRERGNILFEIQQNIHRFLK